MSTTAVEEECSVVFFLKKNGEKNSLVRQCRANRQIKTLSPWGREGLVVVERVMQLEGAEVQVREARGPPEIGREVAKPHEPHQALCEKVAGRRSLESSTLVWRTNCVCSQVPSLDHCQRSTSGLDSSSALKLRWRLSAEAAANAARPTDPLLGWLGMLCDVVDLLPVGSDLPFQPCPGSNGKHYLLCTSFLLTTTRWTLVAFPPSLPI